MGLRVVRRAVVAAVAGVVASLAPLAAGPAIAGGPTSVVLSLPGTGRMNVLHVSSADYEALQAQVGGFTDPVPTPAAGEGTAARHDQGPVLTLTWLIHDVQPWRVDYVYLLAPGGPWIATRETLNAGDIWALPQTWHRPADAVRLRALVHELKVDPTDWSPADNGVAPEGMPADSDPLGLPSSRSTAAPAAASARDSGGSAPVGWVWGIAGLVCGAVLTVAGEWAWSRRRGGAAPVDEPAAPEAGEPGEGEPGAGRRVASQPAEIELDPVVVSRR